MRVELRLALPSTPARQRESPRVESGPPATSLEVAGGFCVLRVKRPRTGDIRSAADGIIVAWMTPSVAQETRRAGCVGRLSRTPR